MSDYLLVQNKRLEKQYINNTKLARTLATKQLTPSANPIHIELQIDKNKDITDHVVLSAEPTLEISQPLDILDMQLVDTIYSLLKAGHTIVTDTLIAREWSGQPKKDVPVSWIGIIHQRIEKLSQTRIVINWTAEYNKRHPKAPSKEEIISSQMLNITTRRGQYISNGKEIHEAYRIESVPVLYEYAEKTRQIICVPADLLDTGSRFNNTIDAVIIKRYVIKRVLQIEHENFLNSPKLSLEWIDWDNRAKGLYAELGIDPNNSKYWRTKVKPRIMKIIRGTLDSLIEKGIIIGYTEYRDDGTNNRAKAIKGFLIELPPSEKKGHARRKPGTQKP